MKNSPQIIANWKMNLSLRQANLLCEQLLNLANFNQLILAPSAPYLALLADNFSELQFAAQNVSDQENYSSFTGEYSAKQIKSCKINYAIIGHSEQKTLANETINQTKLKISNCLNAEIIPIICCGETKQQRDSGNHVQHIVDQLNDLLRDQHGRIIIAYEPVWAVGSGLYPACAQLLEIFEAIQGFMQQNLIAIDYSLVYGGSVNLTNIQELWSINMLDGLLVGNASLEISTLTSMLQVIR